MNKILRLLPLALGCLLFTACGDDEDYSAVPQSTINVLSAETEFSAPASTGKVELDCTPIAAYSDEPSWLTVSIDGNTVNLATTENPSRQSRNAKLVVKKAEADSVVMNVYQQGVVFVLDIGNVIAVSSDEAQSLSYPAKTNIGVTILSAPDWVNVSVTDDSFNIDLTENNTGHLRSSFVKYKAGEVVDSIKVTQYDFDKDIAGDYYFLFYNTSSRRWSYFNSTLTENTLTLSDLGLTFAVTFDEETASINMTSGQYLGQYAGYYVYGEFCDSEGGFYYGGTTGTADLEFLYDEETDVTYGYFEGYAYNNSSYTEYLYAICLYAYSLDSPSSSTRLGTLTYMPSPQLEKKATTAGARAKALNGKAQKATAEDLLKLNAFDNFVFPMK